MSSPRLVATDLDGTLVRADGTISARTAAAIARAEAAGAKVVLVTGRPPRWIGRATDIVGAHTPTICSNGAFVYDARDQRVLAQYPISAAAVAETMRRLRAARPDLRFAAEYADGFAFEPGYLLHEWDAAASAGVRVNQEAIAARPAAKLLAKHPVLGAEELVKVAEEVAADLVRATHSSQHLLEMAAVGVTKASTLAELAATEGIAAAEVIAFGDMPNDLEMLNWAGRSVAPRGAHPDVLAAVDLITASCDDDGVAQVLEEIFPLP